MEAFLAEKNGYKQIALPKDINASALVGERISLEKGHRCGMVISCDAGAEDLTISLEQHDAASAGNSKALLIKNNYYIKKDAETKFTKVEVLEDTPLSSIVASVSGVKAVIIIETLDSQLDINGGYNHVSLNIAAGSAAKVVSGIYELHPMRFGAAYLNDL